jgi:glycosyltransferase involved in cell wall biosynthesis
MRCAACGRLRVRDAVAESLRILGVGDAKSRHFARWATRLTQRGHEVHVASGRVNPREGELDGLVVHQFQELDPLLRVPLVRRYRMAPALARLARRVQPDVVHSHYLLPYGYWTARAGLGPLVVSPWGKDAIVDAWSSPEAEKRARVAIAPELALAYVVNSQALEDAAVRLGADRAKFHRIYWHARIDGYSPQRADRFRWRALGWPDDAVVCLSLRNFRPYSNLDIVLRAFAKAREQAPELRLFSTAGGGWTRTEFDRLATELGLERYMAVQDIHATDLPSVTASADFAVTLADVDSSPASLLETMASGVPLVVGLAPSMDEWIQQGEGGELVEDRHDVDAVAAAMVRLARDPELRRRYGERNLREVHARFGDPTGQLEHVYREVLGR